jgi:molybdopterin converting factor small subunit
MRVRLISFGPLKTVFADGGEWRELRAGESVSGLLAALREEGRVNDAALRTAAVAVNRDYVPGEHVLCDGDEVAILPPVSGGAGGRVELVRKPIDADAIVRQRWRGVRLRRHRARQHARTGDAAPGL